MPFIPLLLAYLSVGAITGIAAGLLGVGGGLIVVPALATIFAITDPGNPWLMQMALGTSLATIIPTSISSLLAHYRRGAVNMADVQRLAPGLMVGALVGAWFASLIDTHALKIGYGVFILLVAAQMLTGIRPTAHRADNPRMAVATAIGIISALAGIGGGSMTVPYLTWKGRDLRQAIATSAACGLPIALAATIGFNTDGLGKTNHVTGFINFPAFISIAAASILTAPIGAKLAHTLPVPTVKRVFAVFLAFVGLRMLLG